MRARNVSVSHAGRAYRVALRTMLEGLQVRSLYARHSADAIQPTMYQRDARIPEGATRPADPEMGSVRAAVPPYTT